MKCQIPGKSLWIVALLGLSPGLAAQAPEVADESELRRELRRHYQNGMRAELGLTDEQMKQIMPTIEDFEQRRAGAREARQTAVRDLRRGLRGGATDDELQQQLDRMDGMEREEQELERTLRGEVDTLLTVRQRVKFRFFTRQFRRQIEQQIRRVRGEPSDQNRPRRSPKQRR